MKDRSSLQLMEILIMILVFALCAALCIQCFVWADGLSEDHRAKDIGVSEARNAAEAVKATRGDLIMASGLIGGSVREDSLYVYYGSALERITDPYLASYTLRVSLCESGTNGLGKAHVSFCDGDGEIIFEIYTAWQEERTNG